MVPITIVNGVYKPSYNWGGGATLYGYGMVWYGSKLDTPKKTGCLIVKYHNLQVPKAFDFHPYLRPG